MEFTINQKLFFQNIFMPHMLQNEFELGYL